jgi:hypothetical protein
MSRASARIEKPLNIATPFYPSRVSGPNRERELCTRRGRGLSGEGRGSLAPRGGEADDADHTRSGRLSSAISVADSCQLRNGWAQAPMKVVPSCDKRWVGARNL